MTDYVTDFVQESEEQITELNNALLALEQSPDDDEAMEQLFRIAHTLKGNCGAMGLEPASDLAHAIEDLLDAVRSGDLEVSAEMMDGIFDAVDELETMIGEVAAAGEIETDPSATIEALRAQLEAEAEARAIERPSPAELDDVLARFEPPANPDHDAYLARLAITPHEEINYGELVVEALIDAFDLLGTEPPRSAIEADDYGDFFDAVFGTPVGEAAIASGLEPVEEVADFEIVAVTDRLTAEDETQNELSTDEAQELEVDDLLDEFDEFDNLDERVEEFEEDELDPFDDMGDAGSFDDLLGDDVDDLGPASESSADSGADSTGTANDASETGVGDASAADESVDDAGAVFDELKDEVEMVGFDELQDELAELEFDEFDDDEEVSMEELLGEDAAGGDGDSFFDDLEAGTDLEADEVSPEANESDLEKSDDRQVGADAELDEDRPPEPDGPPSPESNETPTPDPDEEPTVDDAGPIDEADSEGEPASDDAGSTVAADASASAADSEPATADAAPAGTEPEADADDDLDGEAVPDATVELDAGPDPSEAGSGHLEERSDRTDVEEATEDAEGAVAPESPTDDRPEDSAADEADPATAVRAADDSRETESVTAAEPSESGSDAPTTEETDAPATAGTDSSVASAPAEPESDDTTIADAEDAADTDGVIDTAGDSLDDRSSSVASEEDEIGTPDDDGTVDDAEATDETETAADADGFDSVDDEGSFGAADDVNEFDASDAENDAFEGTEFGEDELDAPDAFDDETEDVTADVEPASGSESLETSDAEAFETDVADFDDESVTELSTDSLEFEDDSPDDFEETFGDPFADESDSGLETGFDDPFADARTDDAAFGAETDASEDDFDTDTTGDDAAAGPIVDEPDLEIPDVTVPERPDRMRETDERTDETQSVRVDVEQIDSLLTLVEGLVTSRVRLRHAIDEGEELRAIASELDDLEDLTTELQETVTNVRLVPLNTVTNRLPRVVRDIAREQDKEVSFEMTGEDVELDRGILDRIGDPLIHLVRNAVDHGIEPPERRDEADKPREGSVTVTAERARDRVTITVADDGGGLDPDRLRTEAVEADILTDAEAADLSDDAAYDLVFHPGLSTADEVTDVSGRGVGMDVVERTIEDLDGTVIVDSDPGEGTTVTMTLPVSVAIDDVLFLESGGEEFGVPTKAVADIQATEVVEIADGTLVRTDGDDCPFVSLDEALETPNAKADGDGMVVRIRDEIRPVALGCDHVHGQQEVVVTPFEGFMSNVPGVSGATVRGRGEVVTILDVPTL
ncbi:Hpt domain-containing protein [Natronococcus wangiae]|uniref:Hpt domain-containing protein n=1 Tax=Natronococcus wangiae TaxID=3068275 RepID=UPI00273DA478|nr:Hpt domain-containing protein [Natronococcus sp. AD5]